MEGLNDDIRRVMARNAEILECRRQLQHWSDRLSVLEAEWRREYLLERMEYDPQGTWDKLSEEEKQEKDFVVKALACTPCVFGYDPFSRFPWNNEEELPEQFREDRDAVISFISSKDARFAPTSMFPVPESLKDDREVMTILCNHCFSHIRLASPRLRADRGFVLATMGDCSMYQDYDLRYVSAQLRNSNGFMLDLLKQANMESIDLSRLFEFSDLPRDEERQLALAVLERLQHSGNESLEFLREMSPVLCDDKHLMLLFVKFDWRSLKYCSDRLKSDEDIVKVAVSQNSVAATYALGPCKKVWLVDEKHKVIKELENRKIGFYDGVPPEMKSDTEVLVAALKLEEIDYEDLSPAQRVNRDIILAHSVHAEKDFYRLLPEDMRNDATLCEEMLKASYTFPKSILGSVPSLYSSRDAIMGISKVFYEDQTRDIVPEIICRSPFRDDREVMLTACQERSDIVELSTERLRSDRDFIADAMTRSKESIPILYTPDEFQIENIDLVVKAVEMYDTITWSVDYLIENLSHGVWRDRSVILACFDKGWSVLENLDSDNPLLDDAELIRLAVRVASSELQYASQRLKADREFILSLVKNNGHSLRHADTHLRNDDDILLAAVADTPGVIVDCFESGSNENFEPIVSFASRVRSKLELHETFVRVFLGGIAISRPHRPPLARCHLPLLDRGIETSTAFKKRIARFADIPIGEELQLLRKASLNLRKLGY